MLSAVGAVVAGSAAAVMGGAAVMKTEPQGLSASAQRTRDMLPRAYRKGEIALLRTDTHATDTERAEPRVALKLPVLSDLAFLARRAPQPVAQAEPVDDDAL